MASRLKRQSSSTQVFSLSFSNYFHGTDHSNFIYLSSGSAVYYSSLAPSNGVQLHHPLPIPNLNPILIPFPKFSRMQSLLTLLTLFRPLYETIIPNEYNTAQLLSAFLAGCPAIIGTARAIIEAHTTNKSNFKLSGIERGAGDVVYAYLGRSAS
ncbi:hypothetical protein GJ744_002209 [Endocarpon pusillum]|uniref:Uncharacterized protein n=1 Tax=Endocarpon pusillum TaxID=364733 RepID=A0A8H7AC80_9EURO|nr:hypothetical protein GJ744_002209 [Endocarpon pusillum]